jgi:hypothetical protein
MGAVKSPHAIKATVAIASPSWFTMYLLFLLGTSVAPRCPRVVNG